MTSEKRDILMKSVVGINSGAFLVAKSDHVLLQPNDTALASSVNEVRSQGHPNDDSDLEVLEDEQPVGGSDQGNMFTVYYQGTATIRGDDEEV